MTNVSVVAEGISRTITAYWKDPYQANLNSKIVRSVNDEKRYWYLVLDETIFHPKGGGQPSDRGWLEGDGFKVEVKKAMLAGKGVVVHWGRVLDGTPSEGPVKSSIDWNWRFLMMRRHTAAHLLDHCLAQATGASFEARDSWLGEPCYVAYDGRLPTEKELRLAEEIENRIISSGAAVKAEEVDEEEARRVIGDRSNVGVARSSKLRFVTIEGCEPIPCGGTHLRNASEAGGIKLGQLETFATGFRVYFDLV